MSSQDKECWWCGITEYESPITLHHAERRGSHPDKIYDPENLVPLCAVCHALTETSEAFYKEIQLTWKANKELQRRQSLGGLKKP